MSKKVNFLLKIIAEESVKNAYEKEKEYQLRMSSKMLGEEDDEEEDDPIFGGGKDNSSKKDVGGEEGKDNTVDDMDLGGLSDEEPSNDDMGDQSQDMGQDGGKGEKQEPKNGGDNTNKVGYVQSPLTLELGKVTVDGVGATLNMIRAGRSFKDSDIATQLETWFGSLSQAEQLALGTFLDALKDIAEGSDSTQSPDPSDPSIGLNITSKDNPQVRPGGVQKAGDPQPDAQQNPLQKAAQQRPGDSPATSQQLLRAPEDDNEDLEDTDAPLIVGKRNESVSKKLREKIIEMINK